MVDGSNRPQGIAQAAAYHIDETLLSEESLSQLSRRFGVSDRHLRRVFKAEFGVEPSDYVATRRMLFAKQLLHETTLPVAQVAYAAGFGSPGRLTVQMRQAYGFTPSQLRRKPASNDAAKPIKLMADYRPPFGWQQLLGFLAGRLTADERIDGAVYYRRIDGQEIAVKDLPEKHALQVTLPVALAPQSHTILRRIRHLFDLDANPQAIAEGLGRDVRLAGLVARNPGVRVPGCWDGFETMIRTVLGQQVSVAAASTLMRRLSDGIGINAGRLAASTPQAIAAIGLPLRRATTVWTLARMYADGELDLGQPDPEKLSAQLLAVPGIGPWTVQYLCMRVVHWPDALPAGDLGLQKAIEPGRRLTERQVVDAAADWSPWRSYATILLWGSLGQGG